MASGLFGFLSCVAEYFKLGGVFAPRNIAAGVQGPDSRSQKAALVPINSPGPPGTGEDVERYWQEHTRLKARWARDLAGVYTEFKTLYQYRIALAAPPIAVQTATSLGGGRSGGQAEEVVQKRRRGAIGLLIS